MSSLTTNYNLKKPAGTEMILIEDINDNMDTIDSTIKGINDRITPLETIDHTHNTDSYLDYGGANQVSALDAKDAVTKKHSNSLDHTQGTDQGLDTGGVNAVIVADIKDAVTKKHAASLLGTKTLDEAAIGNGKVISYNSSSGNLEFATPSAGGSSFWTAETNFIATPASTSTLTMIADKTATILVGYGLRYTIGGVVCYGIVTAITSTLLTIAGAPLSNTVTNLSWCDPTRVIQLDFFIPNVFADAANTGLLASDLHTKFRWSLTKAYLVKIIHTVRIDDTGANQPRVTVSINGSVVGTDNTNAGLAVAETWTSTVVGINTSNYDINTGEAIEIVTDANGTNDDARDLTVSTIWVIP